MIRISAPLLFVLASARTADAAYHHWADGSVTHVPDEIVMLVVLGAVLGLALLCASFDDTSAPSSVTRMSLDLPEEVRTPESVEYYQDVTARTRALKCKLDADTELAESYVKAARARAELEDLDSEAHRRATGRR